MRHHGFNGAPLPSGKLFANILIQSINHQMDEPRIRRTLIMGPTLIHAFESLRTPIRTKGNPKQQPHDINSLKTPAAMYAPFPLDKTNQSIPRVPTKNETRKAVNLAVWSYPQVSDFCHVIYPS